MSIDINDLTIGQAREIAAALGGITNTPQAADVAGVYAPFVGESVIVRTVGYHYTGRLVQVTATELVLEDAAWIAVSARWADTLVKGELDEVEPCRTEDPVIVNRTAVLDATRWRHELPRTQR